MAFGPDGSLYVCTGNGGEPAQGTVVQLIPPATTGGVWTGNTIYTFPNRGEGRIPASPPVLDANGNLYGVNADGGRHNAEVVFQLTPPGAGGGSWTYTVIYKFPQEARNHPQPAVRERCALWRQRARRARR